MAAGDFSQLLAEVLVCPNCGSGADSGLALADLRCATCGIEHFALGQTPCLFPSGLHHKALWQYQAGVMRATGQRGLAQIRESLSRYDLSDSTRARLEETYAASEISQDAILGLLANCGVGAEINEQLGQFDPGDLSEYSDLTRRDWAWDADADAPSHENRAASDKVLSLLREDSAPERVLVLGAGAGRLSWDVHRALRPALTLALDSNPVLLAAADHLIKQQQPLTLGEFKTFPQINCPAARQWHVQPVADPDNLRATWCALGANVWRLPVKPEAFDLVVTPWFIDVNGGDLRDLIGIVAQTLRPGGRWLNYGPLLFTRHLPLQLKYNAGEIKELLLLAGFSLEAERLDEADHLASPLEVRRQHEQLWTFCARLDNDGPRAEAIPGVAAPWLVMHHLPVPAAAYRSQQQHALIDAILALVDGERSINQISFQIAPHLPEGVSAKDLVVTLFGQILTGAERM